MSDEKFMGGCDPSDCASCGGGCGSVPRVPNPTIKLTLEDDTELECAVLTTFDVNDQEYIPLLPLDENGKNTNGDVYLFRFSEDGDQPAIENIERNDEYMAAAEAFDEFMSNLKEDAGSTES